MCSPAHEQGCREKSRQSVNNKYLNHKRPNNQRRVQLAVT